LNDTNLTIDFHTPITTKLEAVKVQITWEDCDTEKIIGNAASPRLI